MKKITLIGGGTGSFVVLSGLKLHPIDLGVIVNVMDSGGSTGRLRDQMEVLPPGDLRQCLVALSEAPMLWRKLFLYRFTNGDLQGHNFGNLFLSVLEKITSSYDEVIDTASYVLKTKGKVIPVTHNKTHLCAEYENGKILKRENNIDENIQEVSKIKRIYLEPEAESNPKAKERIAESDYLIVGPGDLYTSIFPVVIVNGVKESIIQSKAKIIYIMNLMTKSGQTNNYKASDHLADFKKYFGKSPDHVIVNNETIPQNILKWYLDHNEKPVENDLFNNGFKGTIIEESIIDDKPIALNEADTVARSILRHSPNKLAQVILKIINA